MAGNAGRLRHHQPQLNLALIETVRDWLRGRGVEAWLAHNPERTKANLFATLPAQDGNQQGGIVLSGHTDVVPVDGQDWGSDPFKLIEKDGLLYGRGSCDMKASSPVRWPGAGIPGHAAQETHPSGVLL